MAHFEKKLESKTIFQGRVIELRLDQVELEDGSTSQREVVLHHGGAGVLAIDERGRVCMVRQFRYALGKEILEIPAGKLEPGEDPKAAAQRELLEECGLRADRIEDLGAIYPTVGYDSEIIHLYRATGLHQGAPRPDQGEFLTLEWHSLDSLVEMIQQDTLRDAKTVAAILKEKLR
jgi:ADP-ribose pyrophosphatase